MRNASARSLALAAILLLGSASAVQERPAPITLRELVARRDLWPATAALRKNLRLQNGVSIPAGKELAISEISGSNVVFDSGRGLFDYPATDTDVLQRAQVFVATLTPEQYALTEKAAAEQPGLWPVSVELRAPMAFDNGVQIPTGRKLAVRSVENGVIGLYDAESNNVFQAELFETDFIAGARRRLEIPKEKREPFFIRSVQAALESDAQKDAPKALANADLVLVVKGRLGCSRCAAFVPELKKFYERVKPGHANFEVVFLSSDASADGAKRFVQDEGFPGQVLAYDRRLGAANLASLQGQLLPLVFLLDRDGKVVAQNHPNGGAPSAADVLGELEKRLKK